MNLKKIGVSIFFNIVCAMGATLALIGIILAFWFFFVSVKEGRIYKGVISLFATCIGYAIYSYVFPRIHKKWSDHY